MKNPFRSYARYWKRNTARAIDPDSTKDFASRLRNARSGLARYAKEGRGPVRRMTYHEMLRAWGLGERQIAHVVHGMRIERTAFVVIGLFSMLTSLVSLWRGGPWIYSVSALLIVPVSVVVILVRTWRIDCLEQRRFVPFRSWLSGADE